MTEQEKVQFDMKLEVVVLGVSDVDRAKAFYENLGWRLDADFAADGGDFAACSRRRTTRQPRSSSARGSHRPSPARRTA